jgi:hypothetical protein
MGVYAGPDIVESGLVLALDAGNVKSYPGFGATWFDLSGKGYNATLFNTPTFVNNTLQFRVASLNYATCSFNEGLLKNTNETGNWTIESAFKYVTAPTTSEAVVAGRQGCHGGIYINTNNTLQHAIKTNECWTGHTAVTASTMTDGNWYHTTMVYSNGTTFTYLNGVYINSGSINLTTYDIFNYSNTFWIGGIDTAGTDYFTNIDLSLVKCYNRALTAAEILQNYRATKSRFGL